MNKYHCILFVSLHLILAPELNTDIFALALCQTLHVYFMYISIVCLYIIVYDPPSSPPEVLNFQLPLTEVF